MTQNTDLLGLGLYGVEETHHTRAKTHSDISQLIEPKDSDKDE
jgi:hypothetical protein